MKENDKTPAGGSQESNLWFTIEFKKPLEGNQRKIYQGFLEGWVEYHDLYVDKVKDNGMKHKVWITWINSDKTAKVYIDPLMRTGTSPVITAPENLETSTTSSFTYTVAVSVTTLAVSDPPVPPPPPPPSGI